MEEWRKIEEFNGAYEVSSHGRVRSVERKMNTRIYPSQIMKPFTGNNNCLMVRLRNGKKQVRRSIAKLVLITFVGEPPQGSKQVKHIDGNFKNNILSNLKWDVCKSYYLPANKIARELFEKEALANIEKYIRIKGIERALEFGVIGIDDFKQLSLIKIWRNIDSYNETDCSFYNFCATRCNDIYLRLYSKYVKKKQYEVSLQILVDTGDDHYIFKNSK